MRIIAPEVESLLQQFQVPAQFNVTPVSAPQAIQKTENLFELKDNNAKFKEKDKNLPLRLNQHGLVYLGFFLTASLNMYKNINITLEFGEKLVNTDLIVILRSFVKNNVTDKFDWHQTYTIETKTNQHGIAIFSTPPLVNMFNEVSKIHGICVFIMKPKKMEINNQTVNSPSQTSTSSIPQYSNIRLNIRKHIDLLA